MLFFLGYISNFNYYKESRKSTYMYKISYITGKLKEKIIKN